MSRRAWTILAVLTAAFTPTTALEDAVATPRSAFDPLPMRLPGPTGGVRAAQADGWILGVRSSDRAHRFAARIGGEMIGDRAVRVTRGRAREAAKILRAAGLLVYAEADAPRRHASALDGHPEQWARAAVTPPDLGAPAPSNVRIGVIDDLVDVTHADLAHATQIVGGPVTGPHGTMVASVIAAAAGNGGVMGVWPSARLLSWGSDLTCGDVARGIDELRDFRVQIINLSFGSAEPCVTENIAIQQAIGEGIVVVAAAGNDFESGNRPQYPANYPHVMSVAALNPDWSSARFSNVNLTVDVSAPGVMVPAAVPVQFDVDDGVQDGITFAEGTSFAAPMVSAAAAWIQTARPRLDAIQVADVLRYGARDLGADGWDAEFGWGAVTIPGSLAEPAPPRDPLEPNDDIPYVDGTYFRGADPRIYSGRSRRLGAAVDLVEDPYDTYRIRMPGRSRLVATLRPRFGNADLRAYHGGALRLSDRRAVIAASSRRHGPDRVRLVNSSRRPADAYIVVAAAVRSAQIDARYSLAVTRTR